MNMFKRIAIISLALPGFIVSGIATAELASAHTPAVSPSCNKLDVNMVYYNATKDAAGEFKNTIRVTDNGVVLENAKFGESFIKSYSWSESQNHNYVVKVFAWDDSGYNGWSRTFTGSVKACKTEVTPVAPKVTNTTPVCDKPTIVTVTPTKQDGIVWSPSGNSVLQPGQSVTYKASLLNATFLFASNAKTMFTYSNNFVTEACPPPVVPPVVTPPVTPPTPPVVPPTAPPVPPSTPVVSKPKAVVKTSCTGMIEASLYNKESNVRTKFVVTTSKGGASTAVLVKVKAGETKVVTLGKQILLPGTKVTVKVLNGKKLDQATVPARCSVPVTTPHTGKFQMAPAAMELSNAPF